MYLNISFLTQTSSQAAWSMRRKDHGSWCRWCLWSWLALAWLPLTPAPAPEPCSGNTILEMIRDYAPDCISSCPDICTPLGGLIFSVFAGEMNATKLICPEWEIFSCMAKTEGSLGVLHSAVGCCADLCGHRPAPLRRPTPPALRCGAGDHGRAGHGPYHRGRTLGPPQRTPEPQKRPAPPSTTDDDHHDDDDDDDDEEEDASLSVQSATAFTPSSAQGQPYTFTNTTTSTQTTTVFETETMTQTTSITTVVSVTHTTTVVSVTTTATSTRETFGSVDAVSAAKGIRLSGTRGTVGCNSFKFTPNSFIYLYYIFLYLYIMLNLLNHKSIWITKIWRNMKHCKWDTDSASHGSERNVYGNSLKFSLCSKTCFIFGISAEEESVFLKCQVVLLWCCWPSLGSGVRFDAHWSQPRIRKLWSTEQTWSRWNQKKESRDFKLNI